MYAHTGKEIVVADTTFVGYPTKLRLSYPRKRCTGCGYVYQPKIKAVCETRFMTKRLYAKLANLSLKRSFIDIANEYGVKNNTVKNVFRAFIKENKDKLRFETPAFIGLDEINIKKLGELTVITDLEHRTLYDMLQGRNQASLTAYFSEMPNRERVQWVCTDMYRPFEKSIKDTFPNSKWVIDHYHVVGKKVNGIKLRIQRYLLNEKRKRLTALSSYYSHSFEIISYSSRKAESAIILL